MKKKNIKEVKMPKFLVCAYKSQDFMQSQKLFARSHNRGTVTFRNSDTRHIVKCNLLNALHLKQTTMWRPNYPFCNWGLDTNKKHLKTKMNQIIYFVSSSFFSGINMQILSNTIFLLFSTLLLVFCGPKIVCLVRIFHCIVLGPCVR